MHFARKGFGGRGQGMCARRGNVRAALFDHGMITIAHWVRHHHKRQIIVADALCRHLRQRRKCRTHHGNGRDAQRFEFGRVTRGPRG